MSRKSAAPHVYQETPHQRGSEHMLFDCGNGTKSAKLIVLKRDENSRIISAEEFRLVRRYKRDDPHNCGFVLDHPTVNVHPTAFIGKNVIIAGQNVEIGAYAALTGKIIINDGVVVPRDTMWISPSGQEQRFTNVTVGGLYVPDAYAAMDEYNAALFPSV